MVRYTLAEISDRLAVDKEEARGLLKFLVALNVAEMCGARRNEKGGRGENVYLFREGYDKIVAARLRRGDLV